MKEYLLFLDTCIKYVKLLIVHSLINISLNKMFKINKLPWCHEFVTGLYWITYWLYNLQVLLVFKPTVLECLFLGHHS